MSIGRWLLITVDVLLPLWMMMRIIMLPLPDLHCAIVLEEVRMGYP
jgi:hypothetical protein